MHFNNVSEPVIRRMPKYYRQLKILHAEGVDKVSSATLAQLMGFSASQIRQDFNCFGGFGQQGYGYSVELLLNEITNILALNKPYDAVIVGAGKIGHALANYNGFEEEKIYVKALFDIDPKIIGTVQNQKPIYDVRELESYIKEHEIALGIITVNRNSAQEVADRMVNAGIKAIWNFAPIDVVAKVPVENAHLSDDLYVLTYRMNND